jgi:hypothetical protein
MSSLERELESPIVDRADDARDDAALSAEDHELDLYCAGRLSAARAGALLTRARGDVDLTRKLEALRPIGAELRERMADTLYARLLAERVQARAGFDRTTSAPRTRKPALGRHSAAKATLCLVLPGLAAAAGLLPLLQVDRARSQRSVAQDEGAMIDRERPSELIFRPAAFQPWLLR